MPKCIWKFWFGIRRIKMNIYFLISKLTYLSQNIAKEKWKKIIKGMRGKCCGMHHVFYQFDEQIIVRVTMKIK